MTADDLRPPGIYFNLPHADHIADPGLGSTDHKALLLNAVQWQWKRLKELREELGLGDPTPDPKKAVADAVGKAFGDCVHTIVLDGQDAFDAKYCVIPDQPPGLLLTKEQIREALGSRCTIPLTASTERHMELAKVHQVGPLRDDWDLMRAEIVFGRTEISRRWDALLRLIARMLDSPRARLGDKSIRERVLTGGMPEVTVIWIDAETGVRYKCRFDYLRIRAMIDLKTYRVPEDQEIVSAFAAAVNKYAYDMQAEHYAEGREAVPQFIREGRVFGDAPANFLDQLGSYSGPQTWTWLTVSTTGMPEIDVQEFKAPMIQGSARAQLREARKNYLEMRDRFGVSDLWVAERGIIDLEDITLGQKPTMRGAQLWTPR